MHTARTTGRESAPIPVYLITGFLGSGKTTLLLRLLDRARAEGMKPAVVMNELGDVNLDGILVGREVPMAELLGGCICCSSRGDLGAAIHTLAELHRPDCIFIESTGAAGPIETLEGIADAALSTRLDLRAVVAVVDGPALVATAKGRGKTMRLMRDQIRCATRIVLNKKDKLDPEELVFAEQTLRDWNAHAALAAAERGAVDPGWIEPREAEDAPSRPAAAGESAEEPGGAHGVHEHVAAFTAYLHAPVDGEAFDAMLRALPPEVYRAKGVVTFRGTGSRFLFQYAYRETDYVRLAPDASAHDTAVFIGEGFDREAVAAALARLEAAEGS